ncbi:MAG TPA: NUDIX domain-containing protein, partial [Chitinophagaceae bacterium]
PHENTPAFGVQEDGITYRHRPGAYAVLYNQQREVCLVRVPSGYALPGGGIEQEEDREEALLREVYEETGFGVELGAYLGSAFQYKLSEVEGYVKKECFYYACTFTALEREPVEKDHFPEWLSPAEALARLLKGQEEAHHWAVETFLSTHIISEH